MTFVLGTRSRANLAGVHPDLIRIVEAALRLSPVDFGIAAKAVRTAAEQNALFKQGVTQKDGYDRKSNHQPHADHLGHAVDLTPFVGGRFIVTEAAWTLYPKIASAMSRAAHTLGLAARLKWGCDWYRTMDQYGSGEREMTEALEHYKAAHPGPDFIDGPHFELT